MATDNPSYIPHLLDYIVEIVADPSANLSVVLQPIWRRLHLRGCNSCQTWRSRTFLTLVNLNYLREELYGVKNDRVDKILEVFMSICTKHMEQADEEEFWTCPLEAKLDPRLCADSLKLICVISPKKHVKTIERLWCFKDPTNGMKQHICDKLESMIETSPLLVIEWIEAFHLYTFKQENLRQLLLSSLVKQVDISKYLMTTDAFKDSILSILDEYVTIDRPRRPPTNLVAEFFELFSVSTLATYVYKWAHQDRRDRIPNTNDYRAIKNFDHNFFKASSLDERRILTVQALQTSMEASMMASKRSSSRIKEIIKCILNKGSENFAMAVATFAKDYLSTKDLNEVLPNYNYISSSDKRAVNLEVEELSKFKVPTQSCERIPKFECDDFQCILVDDYETFYQVCNALWYLKDLTVAFDVEASFVCQSEISSQDAALLQLAVTEEKNDISWNTIYLVDIYTLKKILHRSDWVSFFEIFLRPGVRRIGFGIKNDIMFLQNAFPFLGKFFARKKPLFICVQEAVKILSNITDLSKMFFGDTTPQLSLQYITKVLLDAELEKQEQSGNWLIRPLDEPKMKYAATDAYYTLKCYLKIRSGLNKEEWLNLKSAIYKDVEPVKAVQANPFLKPKGKETFEEVIAHLKNVMEEIQPMIARKAEENLIILDGTPFLKFRGILRRCGFKTWDHRDANPKADKKAREMLRDMEEYLKRLAKEKTQQYTYILTNKKTLSIWISEYDNSLICAQQDQPESVILEKIVRQTLSSIDFSTIYKRCSACSEVDSHFEIPMAAYRSIFKSFATSKQFADSIDGLADSMEVFNDAFNSLSLELKSNCIIDGPELHVQDDSKTYRFSINGTDSNLFIGDEQTTFKCDTRLFENKSGRNEVKFCRNCKVFF